MKSVYLVFAFLLSAHISAGSDIDNIYKRYSNGEIRRAEREFFKLPQTPTRDGNRLFLASMFERDGRKARQLLEACLLADPDGKYLDEIYFRLLQLAEAAFDTQTVLKNGADYLNRWEDSRFRKNILAMLATHATDDSDAQTRYLDLLIDEYPGSYYGQVGRIIKANAAFNRKHFITATTHCRRINNSADDNLIPASLIMLARIALKKGKSERALLNYNILNEKYHSAIGQDDLVAALKRVSEKESEKESSEKIEGLTYSIQVGVFAEKGNAKKMAKRIKAYGYKDKIKKRKISGSDYYVVLAGRFNTMNDARTAKRKLELNEKQIFKIMVNDEK